MTDEQLDVVLTQAIERLPARCRFTLIRVHEGAAFERIGAELNLDTQTAHRLHERAMEYVLGQVRKATEATEGAASGFRLESSTNIDPPIPVSD